MRLSILIEPVEDGRVPEGDSVMLMKEGVVSGIYRVIESQEFE